ncbi:MULTISPECIES: sensor histidine kinase [Terrabacter]|uniref:Signal transduction histidine kinase n=1 Tax=Terrabacter tumescens TaxID=60443 RepID=A0ABQ2IBF7_9MICO|nr:histidine kinase [Terrabacter tumescens]WVM94787.1 histidine kinase [Terrabacter sp. C0L_2]GGN02962.1 signal transduction histidine kinase [Terrabacter tumescens]
MSSWGALLRRGHLGTEADRATYRTLHTALLASPALRSGLTPAAAERSLKHLRALLGAPAVAMTDTTGLLAWDGGRSHHAPQAAVISAGTLAHGRTTVVDGADVSCTEPSCVVRQAIVAPLDVDEKVVGTLQVFTDRASAGLVRATNEVAGWVSGQLELAELDASRTRLMEAEVRALRAQISPHFIYNSLTAIASFTRTDPERARELLLDLAEFTRYSFRRHGEFTTLAEELRSIEAYLVIEKARFGDRLTVTVRVAPEVLPVVVPFLCLQPLVENAVQHGIEGREGSGEISILAQDADQECVVTIEDNGVGEDPERVRRVLAGDPGSDSVGLANVDERLRTAFGDDYGLVVETAPGAGTKVVVRLPKFRPGVHV